MARLLPAAREPLEFARTFSRHEFDMLCAGFLPRNMDDRWALHYEAPWLYVARSWTGFVVFGLELEPDGAGARVRASWVSRDPEQYRSNDLAADRERLGQVLAMLLATSTTGTR